MEKIDRLGWAAGLGFESFGVRIGVRVNDAGALTDVLARLPPGWKRARSPFVERLYSLWLGNGSSSRIRRFNLVYADTTRLIRMPDLEGTLDSFDANLRLYVAERARGRIFVHAGVVGWRGRAIVIPGRSHSGKSQLVAALVRSGAIYYSDEYAVLDSAGRIHPYLAPLSLRGDDHRIERLPPRAVGGAVGRKPLPVGLVLVSRYHPEARWRPRALSPGQGVLELLDNTVPARRRPATTLSVLRRAVAEAVVLKGNRGEAAEVVRRVLGAG